MCHASGVSYECCHMYSTWHDSSILNKNIWSCLQSNAWHPRKWNTETVLLKNTQAHFRKRGSFTIGVGCHGNSLNITFLWSELGSLRPKFHCRGETQFCFFSCRISNTLVRTIKIKCDKDEVAQGWFGDIHFCQEMISSFLSYSVHGENMKTATEPICLSLSWQTRPHLSNNRPSSINHLVHNQDRWRLTQQEYTLYRTHTIHCGPTLIVQCKYLI